MYSTDQAQLDLCKQAFAKEIFRQEIELNIFTNLDDGVDLQAFTAKFNDERGVVVIIYNSKLTICGFEERVNEIYLQYIGII